MRRSLITGYSFWGAFCCLGGLQWSRSAINWRTNHEEASPIPWDGKKKPLEFLFNSWLSLLNALAKNEAVLEDQKFAPAVGCRAGGTFLQ